MSDCAVPHAHEHDQGSMIARLIDYAESRVQQCSESATMMKFVEHLHALLESVGVPQYNLPSSLSICRSLVATTVTLVFYYLFWGKRHLKRRKRLAQDLRIAQAKLKYLQEKLENVDPYQQSSTTRTKKEIRIFMDGAFDLLHYGHYNAFRLGRSLGTHLVVGVNSDESISACKGAPLMNMSERLTMVESCKFVDEVVPGVPYIMTTEYVNYVIEKYNIDYVIHGDDPCIVDGRDVYAAAKESGKYLSIPRTEGVSTTDIVGRMLLMTKEHHYHDDGTVEESPSGEELEVLGRQSKFLTTSRMLRLFSAGTKSPTDDQRIIYCDGAWDMMHCGHAAMLKAAKERGDYLIVGIHSDAVVNKRRGSNLPLMNLHERVLSVLSCRYVDDVLIDAPYEVTREMIASLRISEVVHGTNSDDIGIVLPNHTNGDQMYSERYKYPREAGIFTMLESPSDFKLGSIVQRIRKNQDAFEAKVERKMKAENEYYENKYGKKSKVI